MRTEMREWQAERTREAADLQEAAASMRALHGPDHPRYRMWTLLATLMERESRVLIYNCRIRNILLRRLYPETPYLHTCAREYLDSL